MSETISTIRRLIDEIGSIIPRSEFEPRHRRGNLASLDQIERYCNCSSRQLHRWYYGEATPREASVEKLEAAAFNPSLVEDREARVQHYIKLMETRGWIFDPPNPGEV
jgi:hypothetical protein